MTAFARLARRIIYENRWVNLYVDRVRFPNGRMIEEHHLLAFNRPSVMVVAQGADGRFLMVRVSRYTLQATQWEFPAGGVEEEESILAAAQRELLEETGYAGEDFEILYQYYPMNGIADQVFYVVRCRAARQSADFDAQEIDAVRWTSAQELTAMIQAHEIRDGYTLTAFFLSNQFL